MKYSVFILFFFLSFLSIAQDWETPNIENNSWDLEVDKKINTKRMEMLLFSEVALYSSAIYTLDKLWYSDYPRSKFHFINDNGEWLQMDKVGHAATSYYLGVVGIKAYRWTGMSNKRAIWYGGFTGSFFLSLIEFLDGKSEQWGASTGDFIANTSGSLFAIIQELRWNEQRALLKFSYYPTKWALENPEQLGQNNIQRILKDYNGQTYWMSINLKSIFDIQSVNFPGFLNIALGYSADNMIAPYPDLEKNRVRQYLLSLDIDLTRLHSKNKFLNSILHTFGFIKFPMPALEFTNGKLITHPIYY